MTIDTIYFGGGTPSLCTMNEVRCMIVELRKFYNVHPDAEITLEANPDDISEEKLIGWKTIGINRLSIGVQSFFNDDYLSRFKVVVFLSTTGDILTPEQEKSMEKFIENGGGFVGIHAACDTEYDWAWYDKAIGTHFRDHSMFPHLPEAEVVTEDKTHPSTNFMPDRWKKIDEWYNFKSNVRGKDSVKVLLSLNEKSYDVGETKGMGGNHPISWTNVVGKGRVFYTGLGHTPETYSDKNAMPHIVEGIAWAGRF